jgi:hypothetical protein
MVRKYEGKSRLVNAEVRMQNVEETGFIIANFKCIIEVGETV